MNMHLVNTELHVVMEHLQENGCYVSSFFQSCLEIPTLCFAEA